MPGIGPLKGAYHVARRCGFLDTGVGRSLFLRSYFAYKRHWEDPYHALIQRRPELFRGGHVLDIGANVGYTTVLFAGACDGDSQVYAFEPEPFNFGLLGRVLERRGLIGKVTAVQAAVGAGSGSVELWINPSHHGDHRVATAGFRPTCGSFVTAPVVSIDGFARKNNLGRICFIKIDVQGYEPAVCEGMEQTLAANPGCVVCLEYMPVALRELGFEPPALIDWFSGRGYSVNTLMADGSWVAGVKEPAGREGYCDLIFLRESAR